MVAVVQPETEVEYSLLPLCEGAPAILLPHFPIRIGRGSNADVRLNDIHVSRRHCELIAAKGVLVVRDLGSTNGTFVNGIRTELSPLRRDDVLTVGGVELVVRERFATARSS